MLLVGVGLSEDLVKSMEQVAPDGVHALLAALTKLDEVINEDVVAS